MTTASLLDSSGPATPATASDSPSPASLSTAARVLGRTFSRRELIACFLGGALLMVIGLRFLASPTGAAEAFGVSLDHTTTYAHIKGIRDLFTGVLLATLAALGERRATALVLLLGAAIPMVDGAEVFAVHGVDVQHLSIHWGTALVCVLLGAWLMKGTRAAKQG